jgi:hypothetical protein
MFYVFALIGMHLFAGKLSPENVPSDSLYASADYFAMNFDNFGNAMLTLFALLVVNNWFVIMDGAVRVTDRYSRVYFLVFYFSECRVSSHVMCLFSVPLIVAPLLELSMCSHVFNFLSSFSFLSVCVPVVLNTLVGFILDSFFVEIERRRRAELSDHQRVLEKQHRLDTKAHRHIERKKLMRRLREARSAHAIAERHVVSNAQQTTSKLSSALAESNMTSTATFGALLEKTTAAAAASAAAATIDAAASETEWHGKAQPIKAQQIKVQLIKVQLNEEVAETVEKVESTETTQSIKKAVTVDKAQLISIAGSVEAATESLETTELIEKTEVAEAAVAAAVEEADIKAVETAELIKKAEAAEAELKTLETAVALINAGADAAIVADVIDDGADAVTLSTAVAKATAEALEAGEDDDVSGDGDGDGDGDDDDDGDGVGSLVSLATSGDSKDNGGDDGNGNGGSGGSGGGGGVMGGFLAGVVRRIVGEQKDEKAAANAAAATAAAAAAAEAEAAAAESARQSQPRRETASLSIVAAPGVTRKERLAVASGSCERSFDFLTCCF